MLFLSSLSVCLFSLLFLRSSKFSVIVSRFSRIKIKSNAVLYVLMCISIKLNCLSIFVSNVIRRTLLPRLLIHPIGHGADAICFLFFILLILLNKCSNAKITHTFVSNRIHTVFGYDVHRSAH